MSQAPYGLIADIHLHPWSSFASIDPNTGLNTRLQILHNSISETCRATLAAGGKIVVIAGDVFHVRGSVAPTVLNSTSALLDEWVKAGITFIILPGNHDLEGKKSTRLGAAVTALADGDDIIICDESTFFGPESTGTASFYTVPWFETADELKRELTRIVDGCKAIGRDHSVIDVILHAPIDGVIPGLPDHGLTADVLASFGFKRVMSGHYHNHKDLGQGVYSIGAIAHHTWSDVNTKAGYMLVHPDRVEQHETTAPKFVDNTAGLTKEIAEGNYVRVGLKGNPTMKQIGQLREKLTAEWGAIGTRIDVLREPVRKREGPPSPMGGTTTIEQSIAAFVTGNKTSVDPALVLRESLRVLSMSK